MKSIRSSIADSKTLRAALVPLWYLLLSSLGLIVHLIPKRRRIVFISRFGRYDGNIKYFCEYVRRSSFAGDVAFVSSDVEVLSAVARGGVPAWRYLTPSTAWKLARSSILIVDGNEWAHGLRIPLLAGARKVQLWHGSGIKAVGLLRPDVRARNSFARRWSKENVRYDLLLLTSEAQEAVRESAFNASRVFIGGYPRNDLLVPGAARDTALAADPFASKLALARAEGVRVVLYAPTWRHEGSPLRALDLQAIERMCARRDLRFLVKLHPKNALETSQDLRNITLVPSEADIYPIMSLTDVLITDYSSVFVDFLLTDRPMIFFPFDRSEYVDGERSLLIDYAEIAPGPIVETSAKLTSQLGRILDGQDLYAQHRTRVRNRFFAHADSRSSERLLQEIADSGW